MLRSDQVLINDIRDGIREIFEIVEEMEFDEFKTACSDQIAGVDRGGIKSGID